MLQIVIITTDLYNSPVYRAPYSLHWMRPTNGKLAQLFQRIEVKFKMQPEKAYYLSEEFKIWNSQGQHSTLQHW